MARILFFQTFSPLGSADFSVAVSFAVQAPHLNAIPPCNHQFVSQPSLGLQTHIFFPSISKCTHDKMVLRALRKWPLNCNKMVNATHVLRHGNSFTDSKFAGVGAGMLVIDNNLPLPISTRVRHQRSVSRRCAMQKIVASTNFSSSTF